MRQTAAEGEEWVLGVAIETVLTDGILHGLPRKGVLEFGGEERQAVQEEDEIETLLVLGTVVQLTHDGEEVGGVELLERFVEATHRTKVRKMEAAAVALDPCADHVEGAALLDLRRQSPEQPLLCLCPM